MTCKVILHECMQAHWIIDATYFRNNRFVRQCRTNCKLSHDFYALHFAGGAVAQEVDSRGFYDVG